jgi:hypothetical protein
MNVQIIDNAAFFFASLGGLHDVEITTISVDADHQILKITVEDINSNFSDLPEHPGLRPARLLFIERPDIFMDLNIWEGIRISNATIAAEPPNLRLEVYLSVVTE